MIFSFLFFSRGVRRECKNPLYNHAEDRPLSPPPQSKLAIDHPDYSPSIRCIPKRLFADTISRRKKEKKKKSSTATYKTRDFSHHPWKKARKRSPSLSNDEENDDDVGEIRPLKLDFGSGKKKVDASGSSLDREDSWDAWKRSVGFFFGTHSICSLISRSFC